MDCISIMKQGTPYDPAAWNNSQAAYHLLRYPELMVADCYRAKMLAQEGLYKDTELGKKVREQFADGLKRLAVAKGEDLRLHGRALEDHISQGLRALEVDTWTNMIHGLIGARAFWDGLQQCKLALQKFPENQDIQDLQAQLKTRFQVFRHGYDGIPNSSIEEKLCLLRKGKILRRAYPWLGAKYQFRNANSIELTRELFKPFMRNCCEIRPSPLETPGQPSESKFCSEPNYGLFATKKLKKGEVVLAEPATVSLLTHPDVTRCEHCCKILKTSDTRHNADCCGVVFCKKMCHDLAMVQYHKPMCGKDFRFVYDADDGIGEFWLSPLILLKVLAMSVEDSDAHGIGNPLAHYVVSTLKPGYDSKFGTYWSFKRDVVLPDRILQTLGVDIFADRNVDTWILSNVMARIDNNLYGYEIDAALPPHNNMKHPSLHKVFSFVNHDCSPNVKVERPGGTGIEGPGSPLMLVTVKKVKKGEELLRCYTEPEFPRAVRQTQLMGVLGKTCDCKRCQSEAGL